MPPPAHVCGLPSNMIPSRASIQRSKNESAFIRSDLILAFREYFYNVEELRHRPKTYDSFAYRVS